MGIKQMVQRMQDRRKFGYRKRSTFNSQSVSGFTASASVKRKLSLPGKKKPVLDAQRRDIDVVVRAATSKHLTRPDAGLNQKVVAAIRSGYYLAETTAKNVSASLSDRLRSKNPTKIWLAVVLTNKVLHDCQDVLTPVQQELLLEVATIAARPVTSSTSNSGGAFMARMEAFNVLKDYGAEGKSAMEQVAGVGAAQLIDSSAPRLEGAPAPIDARLDLDMKDPEHLH